MGVKNKLTIELVRAAITRTSEFIENCENGKQRKNPQVIAMKLEAKGRLNAYTAIFEAMRGDAISLKIDAGKI